MLQVSQLLIAIDNGRLHAYQKIADVQVDGIKLVILNFKVW